MYNKLTPKQLELTKRQEKILGFLFKGCKHSEIVKKIRVSEPTFYKELKEIKDKCGIIPEEIIAEMALEQIRQLRKKLEMTWEDLLNARADWLEEKDKRGTDEHMDKREQMLEDKYVRMQMQHSFAMRDIINFKKAVGVYSPDINIQTGTQQPLTVVFQGMEKGHRKKEKQINKPPTKTK